MMSTSDNWMRFYNEPCSSHPEIKNSFFCDDVTCKDHEQRLFCIECVLTDFKHTHNRTKISTVLENGIEEWKKSVEEYELLYNILEENYPKISNLVKYLDNEDLMKMVGKSVGIKN